MPRRAVHRFFPIVNRKSNPNAYLVDPLSHMREEDVLDDVQVIFDNCLQGVDRNNLERGARLAPNMKTYQEISRVNNPCSQTTGLVQLTGVEKQAIRDEQETLKSLRGMAPVIITVCLAAFLQGQVQSSINGASLYRRELGLEEAGSTESLGIHQSPPDFYDWALGATNATPFLAAAILGCWLALPISDRYGRKGSMVVAALLVFITSGLMIIVPFASAVTEKWKLLLILRIFNGIGMGIKAVNTPILASEAAIGYWRGTSILAWQLWVACGIMVGFILNLICVLITGENRSAALALILGAPLFPATLLLVALMLCPESPRYYLRRGPNFNPEKAYMILKELRKCDLIAMRDIYLLLKSIQQQEKSRLETHEEKSRFSTETFINHMRGGGHRSARDFLTQYIELFSDTRRFNALVSSCVVALGQQLSGINILAFYSGTFFFNLNNDMKAALYFSIGFGAVNFVCALPAIKTIDTLGRRKWLLATLLPMSLTMAGAALSFLKLRSSPDTVALVLIAIFLFSHTALYSPGMGPIPFTIAAESFPLSHREVGCASAISVNLLFAGLLSIFFPSLNSSISAPGCLGLISGFNLIAWLLVFLLVEETRQVSLEDLDFVFAVPKIKFLKYQICEYVPWVFTTLIPWHFRRYVLRRSAVRADGSNLECRCSYRWDLKPQAPLLYRHKIPKYNDAGIDPEDAGEGTRDGTAREVEDKDDDCA